MGDLLIIKPQDLCPKTVPTVLHLDFEQDLEQVFHGMRRPDISLRSGVTLVLMVQVALLFLLLLGSNFLWTACFFYYFK